jgi:hypothetical protein
MTVNTSGISTRKELIEKIAQQTHKTYEEAARFYIEAEASGKVNINIGFLTIKEN